MAVDTPVPLATSAQMQEGPYADLVRDYSPAAIDDLMLAATREVEDRSDRRLAPFTTTESQIVQGIDPDEYGSGLSSVPMDMAGAIGRSYAHALGAADLVRHIWLAQFAPRYPEFWTPYTVASLTIYRSIGGSQLVQAGAMVGPQPDTGHLMVPVGTFLPIGSTVSVLYSGGYSTVPASLARACIYVAADIALSELDPSQRPDLDMSGRIERALSSWCR